MIDPWGGSKVVESMTAEIAEQAWGLIQEVEQHGGMVKAIEMGLPKMRIEETACATGPHDSGKDVIVGVNAYRVEEDSGLELLEVDNAVVRAKQIERLENVRRARDTAAVDRALDALTQCARSSVGNLLELAVDAARHRATLGEISSALEKVWGRYEAPVRSVHGVYAAESEGDSRFDDARRLTVEFAAMEGRRPRILVAKMGQDGHDRGSKVIATAFADLGFDVDIGPLFQTPDEVARNAVENDVHVVGISTLAGGHKTLVPELIERLKALGRADILVTVGGVVPPRDYDFRCSAESPACLDPALAFPKLRSRFYARLTEP